MRAFVGLVLLLVVGSCAQQRAARVEAAPCPPLDSLYTDTPPGPGRDAHPVGPYPRFVSYVIDSLYILRNRSTSAVADSTNVVPGLPASDIQSMELYKGAVGERWSGCQGVPAILIVTRSRRWRLQDTLRVR